MTLSRIALLVLPALVLWGAPAVRAEKDAGGPGGRIARAGAEFAFDLHAALGGDGNLFYSPHSISIALAMTREGARGRTAAEMDAVLHLPEGGPGDGFADLERGLAAPMARVGMGSDATEEPAYAWRVANALWGQRGFAFLESYRTRLEGAYAAGLRVVDFAQSAEAVKTINDWVAERTNDKIQNLVPEGMVDADTRLVLTNAVYFLAPWLEPFSERATQEMPFTTNTGTPVDVRMMRRVGTFPYVETGDVQAVALPYRGGTVSMIVLLPRTRDGLPALEKTMDAGRLQALAEGMGRQRVEVRFPRFSFTSSIDLSQVLQRMGMHAAFSAGAADFSGMTAADRLFISAVLHKAFVSVDEKGTEAAAATAVLMKRTGADPGQPLSFVADHPFLFFIRHEATGAILFAGRFASPE